MTTQRYTELCAAARASLQAQKATGQIHVVTVADNAYLLQPQADALRAGQGAIWSSGTGQLPQGCAAGAVLGPISAPVPIPPAIPRLPQAQAPTAPAATATTTAMRTATQTTLAPTTPAPLVMEQPFFRADNPILWVGGLALLGVVGYFVFRSGE